MSDTIASVGAKLRAMSATEPPKAVRPVLPSRTPAEIAALSPEKATAYGPYIYANAITLLTGYAKKGKTSFLLYVLGCIAYAMDCLDEPTIQTGIVYLTEERATSMRAALARSGLLSAPGIHVVSRWDLPRGMGWPEIVEAAEATCEAMGSKVVVIDTIPTWAGFRGEAENNAGDVLLALEPLQHLAKHDRAVVIVQHDRKGGGAVGESGRGSSAFAGAVDTIVALRKPDGNVGPNQRLLEAVSRFDGVPETLVIERAEDDSIAHVPRDLGFEKNLYRALGDTAAVQLRAAKAAVVATLQTASPMVMVDLKTTLSAHKPATLTRALDELHKAKVVERSGLGRKNSPYAYTLRADVVSSQTSNPWVRDEKKREDEHGDGIRF